MDVSEKRVLVRADFNVSEDGKGTVSDDFRLRAVLPTLDYLRQKRAKTILLAHRGRPEGKTVPELSLSPVRTRLAELLDCPVTLARDAVGEDAREKAMALTGGEILLLENLRFCGGEETNDKDFAKKLASLGEIFINDGFGASHRAHASVSAITDFLPSGVGLLLEKEITNLAKIRDNPCLPLTAIIGGSKISTKIKLIESFLGKAQNIILGGALANTVLRAQGVAIGKSFIEVDMLDEVKRIEITDTKIHLPVDAVLCVDDGEAYRVGPIGKIGDDESILDIGPDSEEIFANVIRQSKTIIWNGPMGLFEKNVFSHGTRALAEAIAAASAFSVVGGGETVAFLEKLKLIERFGFVSTGGGAMMEFLLGRELPGIAALER